MSKKKDSKPAAQKDAAPEKGITATDLPVAIHAQYIRDLSFENPNAPDSFRAGQPLPAMDISIGMDARALKSVDLKNMYEVVLSVKAVAKRGETTVFIAELQYGIAVSIGESAPEDTHHPLLLIEIPRLAFPYARQIISDLTMQGGYPPLILNPVDFHGLYVQRFSKEIEEARKNSEKNAVQK